MLEPFHNLKVQLFKWIPIGPAPMTTNLSGSFVKLNKVEFVKYPDSLIPSIGGIDALAPVAIQALLYFKTLSPT
jgi:hypothetical protein